MQSDSHTARCYARAFATRATMDALRAEIAPVRTLRLAASLLHQRFEMAFAFFLDAPTADRLAGLVAFEAELTRMASGLN